MPTDAARVPDDLLAHAEFVRALAQAALRGDAECEDLAQDAWVAGLQRAPAAPEHRRSWFARVVRHRAIDLLRGRRRRAAREHAASRPEGTASTLDAVERAETGRRLVAAVLSLDEPFRSAVLLRFLDGLPPRAVAERLGVPVETVRSRVRRGLERLREVLAEREGRSWKQGLAALGGSSLAWGTGALLLGGVAVKKVLAAAAVLVLLGGGGWWAFEHAGERAAGTKDEGTALEAATRPAPAQGPRLEPGAVAQPPGPPAGPVTKIPDPVKPPRRVWGRVVGEDGTPIAGARLRAVSQTGNVIGGATVAGNVQVSTESDAQGRFELPIEESWSNGLTVRVHARGWCLPAAGYRGGTVTVTNEKESVVTLVRGVPLMVSVLDDATGQPVAGAEVAVYASRGYVLYNWEPLGDEVTGADGVAALRVPGGDLRVVASAAGHAQREGEGVNVGAEGARVTVRLERGGTVDGVVVDPEGRPLAGARVGLLRAPAVHLHGVTDGDGRFVFEHVPARVPPEADSVALRLTIVAVDAEGFLRTWSAGDPPPEGGATSRRIVMLRPQALAGRAKYADGTAAAGVSIRASTTVGEPSWGWTSVTEAASVRTAADGSFRIEGVVPGNVSLHTGTRTEGEPVLRVHVEPLGVPPPLEVVVEREPVPVRVRVRDAAGRPVKAAAVGLGPVDRVRPGGIGGQRHTAADGTVSITPGAVAPWWLFVDAPGAGPLLRRVETAEAEAGPIEVAPGESTIEGRAERLDGSPATVKLALNLVLQEANTSTHLAGWQGAVETDADGRFRFGGVHDGVSGLRAVSPGWTVFPAAIPGFSSRSRDLRIVVIDEAEAARLRLEAEVLDEVTQQPLEVQVNVMAQREGQTSSWPLYAVPASAGRFRSQDPCEPGTWTVRASASGYVSAEVEVVQPRTGGLQPLRILLRKKQ